MVLLFQVAVRKERFKAMRNTARQKKKRNKEGEIAEFNDSHLMFLGLIAVIGQTMMVIRS